MRSRRAFGALVLAALCLLAGACTPSQGETPTPAPTTLQPVSPSPTENAIERQQRLDYAAAETSYRAFRTEFQRIANAGGADKATSVLTANGGGTYLSANLDVLRAFKQLKSYQKGREQIEYVHPGGHSTNRLLLNVCEDTRTIILYDKDGNKVGSGELRTSEIVARKVEGKWKMWSATGEKVQSCGQ